jgi:MFS transporter, DHA1 family, tetracycline resistance protein
MKDGSSRSPLLIAFITIFLDLLGFGIIIPIAPFFAESFGATPTLITMLGASYSLMQFFFAPFWGRLSDRVGRRPIILISVLISAIGHFIFAMAPSLIWLFGARMLAGFGNANLGTAKALIADSTTMENRAKGMGMIGAAFGLGFIFGPAIGAALGQISPTAPLLAAGVLSLGNFCLAFFLLPETLSEKSVPSERGILPFRQYANAAQYHNAVPILWISLIYTLGFALMEQASALYIEHKWVTDLTLTSDERIGAASKLTGMFLVSVGIAAAIVQGGLIGRLSRRFGEVRLCRAGLLIVSLALLGIPAVGYLGHYALLLLLGPFMAVGTGILMPSKSSLLSKSIPSNEQGAILGLDQSFSSLGRVIGPGIAGIIYEVHMDYPFFLGALLLGVSFFVSQKLGEPKVAPSEAAGE